MRRWTATLSTLVVLALAIAAVQSLPRLFRPDFPAFVMSIEQWDKVRVAYSDGRTIGGIAVYRVAYHHRDDWTWILVTDEVSPQDPGATGTHVTTGHTAMSKQAASSLRPRRIQTIATASVAGSTTASHHLFLHPGRKRSQTGASPTP